MTMLKNIPILIFLFAVFCTSSLQVWAQAELVTPQDPRSSYDCDGENLWLFEEIESSGWIGFGETWDFESCGFGRNIYFDGTRKVWADMRLKKSLSQRVFGPRDFNAYGWMIPGIALGMLVLSLLSAFLLALYYKIRAQKPFWITCTVCATEIPVEPDNPQGFHILCPGCGKTAVVSEKDPEGKRQYRLEHISSQPQKDPHDDT